MERRLYRSRTNRIIWGVCGGLADYFHIDPVIVRIIFVLLIFANLIGLIVYIILAIVVPLEGSRAPSQTETIKENVEDMKKTATGLGEELKSTFSREPKSREIKESSPLVIFGIIILVVGIVLLLSSLNLFWWLSWPYLWPLIIVAIGILIIIAALRR